MKSLYLVLVALLCFAVVAFAQDKPNHGGHGPHHPHRPEGERPHDSNSHNPEGEKPDSSSSAEACIQIALQCPNDTWATKGPHCEDICGAAPIGNLTYDQVTVVMADFLASYKNQVSSSYVTVISTVDRDVVLTPSESYDDYCIQATIDQVWVGNMPDVFNGVRVFYIYPNYCAPRLCQDGTVVGCDEVCDSEVQSSFLFTPITIVVAVVLLSACCCCCCAKRRRCKAKCQMQTAAAQLAAEEEQYPADQYRLLQQQQDQIYENEVPMFPVGQPIYPPMPMMPTQMMMPHGGYPMMVQAPNGMWYPVMPTPPHPEDM